ncbi:dual specificity protein phosphatase 9 [Thecamonas trahens ATCC 50062]|uniref:Dual specificity protein phosphatase 9 n=1 Tax=Thecamonas trahens ATCC 50062 TaxID=461836 RepID=A0A0L0DIA7_THETB|nr:dual specificity protein phosphatase 9 [Thecamonas trahens ATCC 50062]KNC52069.1 dual specificity protein phosphatase 9 [Thecamonas trahens ATCC 50062]|eukprot:XP_013762074.1 dual specificity protein phosphatase 9 [Thecamonas trahens ATCC 50062]
MASEKLHREVVWNTAQSVDEAAGGRVLVSGETVAMDKELMEELGVSHVLRVGSFLDAHFADDFVYSEPIEVLDMPDVPIINHFDYGVSFVADALASDPTARVLVHCQHGQSRSVTLLAAFLMTKHGMEVEAALAAITRARPVAEPNEGFVLQLKLYAALGCTTDHPVGSPGAALLDVFYAGQGEFAYVPQWKRYT